MDQINEWFSTGNDFATQEIFGNVRGDFWLAQIRGRGATRAQWVKTRDASKLLCTGQPPTTKCQYC